MKIIWAAEATRDLEEILTYIQQDNPVAAIDVVLLIADYVQETLLQFPLAGKYGRVKDVRILVIPRLPYVVPYIVENNTITILSVIHTARHWPED